MLKKLFNVFKKPPPTSPFIRVVENNGTGGQIVLDRPKALNAINNEMYK
jgi:enoyl-CoA hydratase/carnithine racemase